MRIFLTGAGGQLGQAFQDVARARHELRAGFHSMPSGADGILFELGAGPQIRPALEEFRPQVVVNAAAMTDVDACERDPAKANRVNGEFVGELARVCSDIGAHLIHVSTDYVFDGARGHYREDDPTGPLSAYGRSKLLGEKLAQQHGRRTTVARTSVVFGPHKKNFVLWAAGELKAQRPMRIVKDQWVSPTYSYDLASQLLSLVEAGATGVYHTAGADRLSRLEMVQQIADAFGYATTHVQPIESKDLNWLATRPRDSSMSVEKISRLTQPNTFKKSLSLLRGRWQP